MMKKKKYITLNRNDGVDFRTVSKQMNKEFGMNHATTRNILFISMEYFIKNLCDNLGIEKTEEEIRQLAFSQEVHSVLCDIVTKGYLDLKKEEMEKTNEC